MAALNGAVLEARNAIPTYPQPHRLICLTSEVVLIHEFLDMSSLACQSQWHNTANVHIRAVHVHVELQLLTHSFNVLQAFLIIGTCAANPDGDLVLNQGGCEFP